MSKPIILVTGTTGSQGGATLDALLDGSERFHLRALVRDPAAPKARALAARGVELARGDLNDDATLRRALEGVHGVHAVQTPMGQGPGGEERQGKRLATLAAEAGVRHYVQSSAGGAERNSGVPHFESKHAIERHVAALGLPCTVLRPSVFTDNFASLAFRTLMLATWRTVLPRDYRLQMTAARDVGWFAAEAFRDPDAWIGREVEISGDALTLAETMRILRRQGLRPVVSFRIPGPLYRRMPDDFRLMFEWFARDGFHADIPALRRIHPDLLTLDLWAQSATSRPNQARSLASGATA